MRTQIFAYKGYLCINSEPGAEGMIASPATAPGNIGCTVEADKIDVTPEALTMLKGLRKVGGSFASISCFDSNDGKIYFGWLGGFKQVSDPKNLEGDRDYEPSLLTPTEFEVPKEFSDFIDKEYGG